RRAGRKELCAGQSAAGRAGVSSGRGHGCGRLGRGRGIYQVPAKATQAIVELYLRWAPRGVVEWRDVSLIETAPPQARKVRLATVHYRPKPGKTATDHCRQ